MIEGYNSSYIFVSDLEEILHEFTLKCTNDILLYYNQKKNTYTTVIDIKDILKYINNLEWDYD